MGNSSNTGRVTPAVTVTAVPRIFESLVGLAPVRSCLPERKTNDHTRTHHRACTRRHRLVGAGLEPAAEAVGCRHVPRSTPA